MTTTVYERFVRDALGSFEAAASETHRSTFGRTRLEDVQTAVKALQGSLAQEQRCQNFSRLQLLFTRLEGLAEIALPLGTNRVISPSTPKRDIQLGHVLTKIRKIASKDATALGLLLKAYGNLAQLLPDFEHDLSFPWSVETASLICCDLLEYQHRLCLVFSRPGWEVFFSAAWKRASPYLDTARRSLIEHSRLRLNQCTAQTGSGSSDITTPALDPGRSHAAGPSHSYRQVSATGFSRQHNGDQHGQNIYNNSTIHQGIDGLNGAQLMHELTSMRKHWYDVAATNERSVTDTRLARVLAWLQPDDQAHGDDYERLKTACHPGSSDWFKEHSTITAWLGTGPRCSRVLVHGKPGCGKSVLSVQLIAHVRAHTQRAVVFHLCNFRFPNRNKCLTFARGIAAQLLRMHADFPVHCFDAYMMVQPGPCSLKQLKDLTKSLLLGLACPRVVVDGLDECDHEDRMAILDYVFDLSKSSDCKIIVFSQEETALPPRLRKVKIDRIVLSEREERAAIDSAIGIYVQHELAILADDEETIFATEPELVNKLERQIVAKAEGMFLWVRLVLDMVDEISSADQLRQLPDILPDDITEAYRRTLSRVQSRRAKGSSSVDFMDIFNWLSLAERPLYVGELLDGLAYTVHPYSLSSETKLIKKALDCAKPFIEIMPSGLVSFVHSTVKNFLLETRPPTISPLTAEHAITMACCRALRDGLPIAINTESALQYAACRVVDDLFGIYSYAVDHWMAHFKRYLHLQNEHTQVEGELKRTSGELAELGRTYAYVERVATTGTPLSKRLEASRGAIDVKIHRLCSSPEFQMLATICLDWSDRRLQDPSVERVAMFHASTKRLVEMTEDLMSPQASTKYPFIAPHSLARFRQLRSGSAYICRIGGCSTGSLGFADEGSRNDHERKSHACRLQCPEPSCRSATNTFNSQSALKRHCRSHQAPRFKVPLFRLPATLGYGDDGLQMAASPMGLRNWLTTMGEPDPSIELHARPLDAKLPDYQMELMLLEQRSKHRLSMARGETLGDPTGGFQHAPGDQFQFGKEGEGLPHDVSGGLSSDSVPSGTPPAVAAPRWIRRPRVLLVESDPTDALFAVQSLEFNQCDVVTKHDARAANVELKSRTFGAPEGYDIVLMDADLDGGAGIIQAKQVNYQTPIVAMLHPLGERILPVYPTWQSANDVLTKYFTTQKLLAMLEKHLSHLITFPPFSGAFMGEQPLNPSAQDQAFGNFDQTSGPLPPGDVAFQFRESQGLAATPFAKVNRLDFEAEQSAFSVVQEATSQAEIQLRGAGSEANRQETRPNDAPFVDDGMEEFDLLDYMLEERGFQGDSHNANTELINQSTRLNEANDLKAQRLPEVNQSARDGHSQPGSGISPISEGLPAGAMRVLDQALASPNWDFWDPYLDGNGWPPVHKKEANASSRPFGGDLVSERLQAANLARASSPSFTVTATPSLLFLDRSPLAPSTQRGRSPSASMDVQAAETEDVRDQPLMPHRSDTQSLIRPSDAMLDYRDDGPSQQAFPGDDAYASRRHEVFEDELDLLFPELEK